MELYELAIELYHWGIAEGGAPDFPAIFRFREMLWSYGVVIVVTGVILILWARYNQYRYGGPDTRPEQKLVSVTNLAALYSLPPADIEKWQHARILIMEHGPDGTLGAVHVKE